MKFYFPQLKVIHETKEYLLNALNTETKYRYYFHLTLSYIDPYIISRTFNEEIKVNSQYFCLQNMALII